MKTWVEARVYKARGRGGSDISSGGVRDGEFSKLGRGGEEVA